MTIEGKSIDLFIRIRSTTGAHIAPPELREKLVEDALGQGTNLTEVVVAILARRFKVPYEPHGRKTDPVASQDVLNLRIPQDLRQKLDVAGAMAKPKRSAQKEALATLCQHYGLRMPAPVKHTRRRRLAA